MKNIPFVMARMRSQGEDGKPLEPLHQEQEIQADNARAPDMRHETLDRGDRSTSAPQLPENRRPATEADREDGHVRPASLTPRQSSQLANP